MKHKPDFEEITVGDIERFLDAQRLVLKPGMIVLIKTGRDRYNGTKQFPYVGTGMSPAATTWLIDKGIKVMGIDAWGWDLPLPYQIKKAKETGNGELFWPAHLVGRSKEYCHLEQLVNLDALPYNGFKVAAFPLRILGASAAPARVVAIFDE
jgi:kynurenine formamidase